MAQTEEQLKAKYQNVITTIRQRNGSLKNLNKEGEKLFIRAEVASQDLKNEVWNAIKGIDPAYSDLHADIIVNPALTPPPSPPVNERKYTVQPGDSLSKIAEHFYGHAHEYNKIFEANRDRLTDPDHVKAGEELIIPA
jgi:nucleoid-associated protein YgaU